MKSRYNQIQNILGFIGLFVAVTVGQTRADDVVISNFDTAADISAWRFDYGTAGITNALAFSTADSSGSASSGSMEIDVGYSPDLVQAAFTAALPAALDATTFTSLEFDVKVDPGSALDKFGNAVYFQLAIRNGAGYTYNKVFQDNVTTVSTNNGWRHVVVSPLPAPVDDIRAITLDLYDNNYATNGPAKLFVDSLKFAKPSAVVDVVINHFDDSTESDAWRFDYGSGGIVNTLAFSADDAETNATSGSLQLTMEFGVGLQQAAFTENLPAAIDASTYSSLEMDVKVDSGSALDQFGNAVYFQVALRVGSGFSYNKQFNDNVAIVSTNNGWRHIVASPLVGSIDDIRAITLDLYDNNYTNAAPAADTIIYVDNIKFTKPDVVTPPPPPTLSIQPATPGLNLIPLGVFNRESIAAMDKGNTWAGSEDPVRYVITISAYPDTNHAGFQTHLFLDADGADAADTYADYNRPNVVFFDIQNQADGSTFAAFRYKTNEPQGNTFLYAAGTLGGVSNPTAIGTWSLAFDHHTNVTVTAPNGGVFSTNIPPDVAALFSGPINISLGGQANNNSTVGQVAVVNRFQITKGTNSLLDDQFSADAALDPDKWQVAAVDPTAILLASPDSVFWVSWTLPDTGFVFQTNADVTNKTGWVDSTLIPTTYGPSKKVLIHSGDEPNPNQGYFRLLNPGQ